MQLKYKELSHGTFFHAQQAIQTFYEFGSLVNKEVKSTKVQLA